MTGRQSGGRPRILRPDRFVFRYSQCDPIHPKKTAFAMPMLLVTNHIHTRRDMFKLKGYLADHQQVIKLNILASRMRVANGRPKLIDFSLPSSGCLTTSGIRTRWPLANTVSAHVNDRARGRVYPHIVHCDKSFKAPSRSNIPTLSMYVAADSIVIEFLASTVAVVIGLGNQSSVRVVIT